MGTYSGTYKADTITPDIVSAGVARTPSGSRPSTMADTINGLGGDDVLDGGGGGDIINGGGGKDSIAASGGGNVIHGNDGDDTIGVGLPGSPSIGGNEVTNRLYGDNGNDTLSVTYGAGCYDPCPGTGNSGSLFLYGGEGNDDLSVAAPDYWQWDRVAGVVPTYMYGGPGNDTIQGTKADYDSDGSYGGSSGVLYGGPGDDAYVIFGREEVVEKEGEGYDTLSVRGSLSYALPLNSYVEKITFTGEYITNEGVSGSGSNSDNIIIGSYFDDNLSGRAGNDVIYGRSDWQGDTLHGDAGNDTIYGGESNDDRWDGPDTIYGDAGNDTVWAGGGDDVIYGGRGQDKLYGQSDNDRIYGGDDRDWLGGGTGNDWLYGQGGPDILSGRQGSDHLSGGDGNDRYDYDAVTDSLPGAADRDVIVDFRGAGKAVGDRIDLSAIDANTTKTGNQPFSFVGTDTFTAAGQVRVVASGANTLIQANTDGAPDTAEMEILVRDGASMPTQWVAGDFIL